MNGNRPMTGQPQRRGIRSWVRRAWQELVDATEWSSHADRLRPHFSERSTIYDPTAGWDHADAADDELTAERGGHPED
jgi:hypothetical protein